MTSEPRPQGTPRPFRFLASVGDVVDGRRLADDARRAEAIGYSVLVIPDHLVEMLAPVPTLATIAAATDTLRIGTFVFVGSPHVFIGTLDALVDKFRSLRERFGISSVMLGDIDGLAPVVERLAGT